MIFDFFKKKIKREEYPENAKYKPRDFVRFRHRGELHFGIIHEARVDEHGNILYTIQMGGECPTFVYNYNEESIVGKVN